jgi:hypothetical protein
MTMKKFLSSTILLTYVLSVSPTLAQSAVDVPPAPEPFPAEPDLGAAISPIKKGYPAPFTGVLLSPKAIATIIAELNSINGRIKIETDRVRGECLANCDFKVNEVKIKAEADAKIGAAHLKFATDENLVLQARLKKVEESRPNLMLWTGGGVVGGVALTILTVFAVSQASR